MSVNAFWGVHFVANTALLYMEASEDLNEEGSHKLSTCSQEHVPDARHSAKKVTNSDGTMDDEAREVAAERNLHAAATFFIQVVFVCISAQPCTSDTIRLY